MVPETEGHFSAFFWLCTPHWSALAAAWWQTGWSHSGHHACVLSHFSRVWVFATLQTVACQAPLSMGFSREEYWSGLPFPSPGDLPDPGIQPTSFTSPALAGRFFITSATWKMPRHHTQTRKHQEAWKRLLLFSLCFSSRIPLSPFASVPVHTHAETNPWKDCLNYSAYAGLIPWWWGQSSLKYIPSRRSKKAKFCERDGVGWWGLSVWPTACYSL